MKQSLAKHIIDLVSYGHRVAVKDNSGLWKVFINIQLEGRLSGTSTNDSIEKCLANGLGSANYSEKDLIDIFTDEYQIVQIVTKAPKQYKVGQRVDILEIAKELPEFEYWDNEKKEMVGQKGLEISGVVYDNGTYGVYKKDKSDYWSFPHWCLAPHYEEESDDKTEEAIKMLREKGFKIIKE